MARKAYPYRERFHDLAIIRPEFRIMSLHNPYIVAEPGGNSVNVDAFTRANRRKRVTHHMWANPGNALGLRLCFRNRSTSAVNDCTGCNSGLSIISRAR